MNTLELRASQRLQFHQGVYPRRRGTAGAVFCPVGHQPPVLPSPLLGARAGSMHGYDVVDPTRVNHELGREAALRRLVAALREHDMG